jgi:ATP-dependent protease ClpP protease subunit
VFVNMPWSVGEDDRCPVHSPWGVTKDDDNSLEGCHATRAEAEEQQAALYAEEAGGDGGNMRALWDKVKQNVRGKGWYQFKPLNVDRVEIMIYGEIGFDWFGDGTSTSADAFVKELNAIGAPNIDIRINSPGGEIFDGIAIYNAILKHPAKVTTYVDGIAASAASFIVQAGDERVMMNHAQMMIHDGMGIALGNPDELREMAEQLDRQSDNIASIYAERAGGTVAEWRERMKNETWYFSQEAVDAGLADRVDTSEELKVPENKWDLAMFNYAGREKAPKPTMVAPPATPPVAPPVTEPVPPMSGSYPITSATPPADVGETFRDALGRLDSLQHWDTGDFKARVASAAEGMPAGPVRQATGPQPTAPPRPAPVPPVKPDPSAWDPKYVRTVLDQVANTAPAPPTVEAPASPEEELPPVREEPAPEPDTWDPTFLRTVLNQVVNTAPAPPHVEPPPLVTEPIIDMSRFRDIVSKVARDHQKEVL